MRVTCAEEVILHSTDGTVHQKRRMLARHFLFSIFKLPPDPSLAAHMYNEASSNLMVVFVNTSS